MTDYYETKAHPITKRMVLEAFKDIRNNGEAAGVDGISLEEYADNLKDNLYKVWNRMTSGSYFPAVMREKIIPKKNGDTRSLGICNVEDRVAQQVVKKWIEHKIDRTFHKDSYGYRPGKHAHQAIEKATLRCAGYSWVIDIDIKAFFDTVERNLMMKAVRRYSNEKWVLNYIERWLKAGVLRENGKLERRDAGTPQGGVISPLLANIYLHFAFDKWMDKYYPNVPFERYCDDIVVHCKTNKQVMYMKERIAERMKECKLSVNPEKTKIVFCKSPNNKSEYVNFKEVSFDFLGYTLKPRKVPTKNGILVLTLPSVSRKSKAGIMEKIRDIELYKWQEPITVLANKFNRKMRGWLNYYAKFNRWGMQVICRAVNNILIKWVQRQRMWYKKRAVNWIKHVYKTQPNLFVHWQLHNP